jgi:membrane-associated protease RseP (regulator of RpoE activity)
MGDVSRPEIAYPIGITVLAALVALFASATGLAFLFWVSVNG